MEQVLVGLGITTIAFILIGLAVYNWASNNEMFGP